jgi:hypothetical protein
MPGVDLDKLEASPTAARSHLDIVGIIRMALLDFEHTVALEIMFFDAECDQCSSPGFDPRKRRTAIRA